MKREENDLTPEEKVRQFCIIADVVRPPHEIFRDVTNYTYEFHKAPHLTHSSKEPPLKLGKKTELIPIDRYLGLYEPHRTHITIFDKGVTRAAKSIRCKTARDLEYVVTLHEWAHALVHIGLEKEEASRAFLEEKFWGENFEEWTVRYDSIERTLHERIAQLLTFHSLKMLAETARYDESRAVFNRMMDCFWVLNARQSRDYRIDDYKEIPKGRTIESLRLLKRGWLKGIFEAWDIIIRW